MDKTAYNLTLMHQDFWYALACVATEAACDHQGGWEEDGVTRFCMFCGHQEEV